MFTKVAEISTSLDEKAEKTTPATLEEQLAASHKAIDDLMVEIKRWRTMYADLEVEMDRKVERVAQERIRIVRFEISQEKMEMEKERNRFYTALAGLLKQMSLAQNVIREFTERSPNYANHPIMGGFVTEIHNVFTSMGAARAFVTEEDMKRAWKEVEAEEAQKS